MMARLRVGVVGIGFIGAAHVYAIRQIPNVEVVALASSSQERATRHADELGIPRAYGDYRDLVADPEIDVVHNCTPNLLHLPVNRAILEAGKACYAEKPLAMNAAEAQQLLQMARASNAASAVNFNHRGFPMVQEARALIEAGDLGPIHAVHGSYLQDWALFETDWSWRVDPTLGGASRVVADIGSHWMDLTQHVTGSRIVAVMADLGKIYPTRLRPEGDATTFRRGNPDGRPTHPVAVDTEDFASVLVRFENGARGSFTVSQISAGRKNRLSFEVDGGQGSVAWCSEESEFLRIGSRTEYARIAQRSPAMSQVAGTSRLPAGHAEGWSDALTNAIRGFYEQVRSGERRPWVATFEDGLQANRLVDAILASHRSERWVTV
jgi:predicted dehydrogenase